jgi:hypothetical protein
VRTSVSRPWPGTRTKTDTHVIHTRPYGRCVSVNVYREKRVVAGAGFEALDGDVEFLPFFGPPLIGLLYLKNPRRSNTAALRGLDVSSW